MVELKPNQQKTIKFNLSKNELGFFNNESDFVLEPGEFKVFVGGSSKTILESNFIIEKQPIE